MQWSTCMTKRVEIVMMGNIHEAIGSLHIELCVPNTTYNRRVRFQIFKPVLNFGDIAANLKIRQRLN